MIDRQTLLDIARQAMGTRKGLLTREAGYLLHHGQRTAEIALHLCEQLDSHGEIDGEILHAAALFHDIGKGIDPHAETGAELARMLLSDVYSPQECERIAILIEQHNKRGQSNVSLAVDILQDADILDHFGAQAVWLCFLYNGYTKKGPHGALAYFESDENARYQQRSRAALNFDYSRVVLDQRLAIEQSFFTRFREEIDGAL